MNTDCRDNRYVRIKIDTDAESDNEVGTHKIRKTRDKRNVEVSKRNVVESAIKAGVDLHSHQQSGAQLHVRTKLEIDGIDHVGYRCKRILRIKCISGPIEP